MRFFQGRASEELYNEALMQLHHWLKTLQDVVEPVDAIDGALWIDPNNALKVKRDGKFITLYDNVYQAMGETISLERPSNPTPGQIWINENSEITYYDGIKFVNAKANASDGFSMDSFEPFLIIHKLQAGANEVIKKDNNIIEEEFISGEGATDFNLLKGQYATMQNKIAVYVNGRIISKSKYLEMNSSTIRMLTPLKKGERIMFHYIPKNIEESSYTPLKFHPSLVEETFIIEEPTQSITLEKDCVMGKSNMMIYINGRFLGSHYYSIEDNRKIIICSELEQGEEVIVQYVDAVVYENYPDNTTIQSEELPFTQFIWPSSEFDRLFINGKLNLNYEELNQITIQYPSMDIQGASVSAAHVHPKNLSSINKRVFEIDKQTGFVQTEESNTEFYAIKNMFDIKTDDMTSSIYVADNLTTIESATAKSYLVLVDANTEYHITRSDASDAFTVTEYAERPSAGVGYLSQWQVDNVEYIDETCILTTNELTNYLLIQVTNNTIASVPIVKTRTVASQTLMLTKTNAMDSDYISRVGGIQLSSYIKDSYDYLLAITYHFSSTVGRGGLFKMNFDITADSQIIIGNIGDPLLVFAQGHYLIEQDNYSYDKDTGKITFYFPEQLDIGILTFPRYESGFIMERTEDNRGIIRLQKAIKKPLVFVYGEHLKQQIDFEQDGDTIYVQDAEINMSYAVVDCVDSNGDSMFSGEGTLLFDEEKALHYVLTYDNFSESNAILFVNGLLINKKDLSFETGRIYIANHADTTMHYTLLKDDEERFIHSSIKEANVFITDEAANQSLLYIDGNLVSDIEAFGCLHLPERGLQGELKGIMSYQSDKGYMIDKWYKYVNNAWSEYTDKAKIAQLTTGLGHYILENKAINFMDISMLKNKRCSAWLYSYDKSIEYPLMHFTLEMKDNTQFEVLPAHHYRLNQNALSVYIDGYRQYPATANFEHGVKEISEGVFEIATSVPGSKLDYVVELPEFDEAKSCLVETLTSKDVFNQTLKTTIPLLPGFIDLFVDGIRQPYTSFKVIDKYSLVFNRLPIDDRFTNQILVEVRYDYALKEALREIEEDGQVSFICADDMRDLLFAKDFVKIYVNGVYVGDQYDLIYESALISIPKLSELGFAKKGHLISFVWR